jgi:hypothetical protein
LTARKKSVVHETAAGFDTPKSPKYGFSATQPTASVEAGNGHPSDAVLWLNADF